MIEIVHKDDGDWIRFMAPSGAAALISLSMRRPIVQKAVRDTVAALAAKDARIAELEYQVKQLDEYMLKGVLYRDELQSRLADEKERRVYYQDIVYAVCNWIDKLHGGSICCGTRESPTKSVQEAMERIYKDNAQHVKWVLLNSVDKHRLAEAEKERDRLKEAVDWAEETGGHWFRDDMTKMTAKEWRDELRRRAKEGK